MKAKTVWAIALLLLGALLFSCAGNRSAVSQGESKADILFVRGKGYYEAGKWGKAIKTLTEFVYSYSFHESIAEGTYLLAESYYNDGQYDLATSEFRRVAGRFEESEFAERAELMVGESLLSASPRSELDQDKTRIALDAFRDFITYNPSSEFVKQAQDGIQRCREKLAEKEYKAAKLYLKLHKPESVVLYADLIAEEYGGTSWVPEAMFLKGRAYEDQLGKPEAAVRIYEEIIEDYPSTRAAEEAAKRLSKIEE